MKKKFLTLTLISILFLMTGCFSKDVMNTKEFITTMEDKKYIIMDLTKEYSVYDHISDIIVAKSTEGLEIEFYVLSNSEEAINMFETNKLKFEKSKGSGYVQNATSVDNYDTFALTSDGYYMYMCRVENTLIYADVEEKYKDEVEKIVEELGY